MASIKDCSSKRPLQQQLKSDVRLRDDSKASGADQSTGKENPVPEILAKSAVAVKMQIVAGMGNGGKGHTGPHGSLVGQWVPRATPDQLLLRVTRAHGQPRPKG